MLHLTWDQVKDLEKQYMQALLAKAPAVRPRAIGIDEMSIRKRHTYRIVVSDLEAQRPIWFGGTGRKVDSGATRWVALPFDGFLAILVSWRCN